MKILLAGHTIDRDVLESQHRFIEDLSYYFNIDSNGEAPPVREEDLRKRCKAFRDADNLTPETISAAYARISRDPRPVDLLRQEARRWVSKARRSNRRIVFGMGHASVAEHAVFNLDIIGVSRYVTEFIQRHRLCSFTEKSQRYIHLGEDYVIPDEIRRAGQEKPFDTFVQSLFERYEQLRHLMAESTGKDLSETGEDARYVLPMCVTTQMGMTANARNLEYLLQCAATSSLEEFREFGRLVFQVVDGVAPSVIRYTEGSKVLKDIPGELESRFHGEDSTGNQLDSSQPVKLLSVTPDADDTVLRALSFTFGSNYKDHDTVRNVSVEEKKMIMQEIIRRMEPWDAAQREFEYAQACFNIQISAAAFGQLKRHRMASITAAPYNPALGITVPPAMKDTAAETLLRDAAAEAVRLSERISKVSPMAAPYCLLGAHRRNVMMQVNARELIHLSRLREDTHAQWDIRDITGRMIKLAARKMPLCMSMAAGKHEFEQHH
jgi:flavin-dependent thymidylate synthase